MSITFHSKASQDELVEFLADEYKHNTGIPVHLFSVVNATFKEYNRNLAIADNLKGVMFWEGQHVLKSYGFGNPMPLMNTLNRCRAGITFMD